MKIKKKDLLKALEVVKPGLANKEIIEQSTSFAFLGDRVVTYNDSIGISHPVESLDLKGAIRAEELYNLLNRLKTKYIKVAQDENELKVKAGKSMAGIRLQSEIKLPLQEIEEEKDWEDLPEEFCSDINFIKDSASNDMSRRVLTCVHVQEVFMEASDGFQIMRTYMNQESPFPFPGVLIPSEVIGEIIKINPIQIAQTDGWLHFRSAEGTELSCRTLTDDYPSTEAHFEMEQGQKVVFPNKMQEIIDRVQVFTKKDHLMDEEMQVMLKKNTIMVQGKNDYGWIKEKEKVKYEGSKASFWIPPHLLKNILNRSNECLLGEEKIKFQGADWEYIAVLRSEQ